jgi:hypothetical protein
MSTRPTTRTNSLEIAAAEDRRCDTEHEQLEKDRGAEDPPDRSGENSLLHPFADLTLIDTDIVI